MLSAIPVIGYRRGAVHMPTHPQARHRRPELAAPDGEGLEALVGQALDAVREPGRVVGDQLRPPRNAAKGRVQALAHR